MISYFKQQLQIILDARKALARETAQKGNKALLDLHPRFEELLKKRKTIELQISRLTSKGDDASDLQTQLDDINTRIKAYAEENKLNFKPKYFCRKCKDSGYVGDKTCECMTREYNALLRENASLASLANFSFADNKFNTLDAAQAKGMDKLYSIMQNRVCGDFDKCKWRNFMLSGASGVGKTSLALAVADDLLSKNISVFYVTAFELVNIFLDKHTHKLTALSKRFDYAMQCEMLIIDNLGEEPIYKNVTLEYLFSTLDKRTSDNKKTFICTQLTPAALVNRYGETFLSKFADKKYALSVGYITGDNLRKS